MRWSKCFIPTLRESPAGGETAAEKLLVRAGYLRALSAGVYGYLPLGMRSLLRLQNIARRELAAAGGQETLLDADSAFVIARGELRGPKQLPQLWFRLETPLLRVRQFAGLDAFAFGAAPGLLAATLRRTVESAGVAGIWSDSGAVALLPSAPDQAAACPACGAAAVLGLATGVPICAAECPARAIQLHHFETDQFEVMIKQLFANGNGGNGNGKPRTAIKIMAPA